MKIAVLLFIGLAAVSCASILIKMCNVPPLVIASYRLMIASAFYLILTRSKSGPVWSSFSWSQRRVALISGLFLTLHFSTWITSLKFTSVASSVVLVQSAPIFVVLGSFIFLRERPTKKMIAGVCVTFAGSIIVGTHDFSLDSTSLTGNLLAVLGAVGAAGYMIAGRSLRLKIDTLHYVTAVYSVTAVLLVFITLLSGARFFGYDSRNYLLLAAIAIVPQIIGHTIFNWGLRFFSATVISIILLCEPIGASLLALFILDETPGAVKILGGAVIVTGVMMVILAETGQPRGRQR